MGIEELKFQEKYKYLGIQQNNTIDHSHLKNVFTEQYKNRVTKILNTKLAGRNLIIAINTWGSTHFNLFFWNNKMERYRPGQFGQNNEKTVNEIPMPAPKLFGNPAISTMQRRWQRIN